MNIAIIGAGRVGQALAKGWLISGHIVTFGVRDVNRYEEKLQYLAQFGEFEVKSVSDGLEHDIIVLAIPGNQTSSVVEKINNSSQIIVVDATNPIGNWEEGFTYLKKLKPNIRFVKAFNTMGYNIMENPQFGEVMADCFISGDEPKSTSIVAQLAQNLGFHPVIVGSNLGSELERLAWLWINLTREKGREIAFKLIDR